MKKLKLKKNLLKKQPLSIKILIKKHWNGNPKAIRVYNSHHRVACEESKFSYRSRSRVGRERDFRLTWWLLQCLLAVHYHVLVFYILYSMKVSAKQYDHVLIWIPSLSIHCDLVFVKDLKESESISFTMSTIYNQSVLIAPFIKFNIWNYFTLLDTILYFYTSRTHERNLPF